MTLEYQDALLRDINKDLLITNSNLKESSNEINHQGDQISNTMNKINSSQNTVKKTDETFVIIARKEKTDLTNIVRIYLGLCSQYLGLLQTKTKTSMQFKKL